MMNEEDLRDCFAMFSMLGLLINGKYSDPEAAQYAYTLADVMLQARKYKENVNEEDDGGIVAVAPKRTRKR